MKKDVLKKDDWFFAGVRSACFFFFILVFISPAVQAQEFIAKGHIVDELSGKPVEFASLLVKGTSAGAQADEQGGFSVSCKQLPATLVIYKIGYQTLEQPVDGEKAELIIRMRPKALQLAEVVVNGKRTEIFQEKNQTEYLSFEFYDNLIIALVNKGGARDVVQMMDENGTLIKERLAPKGSENLFRDCFGNIQILSKDSSYQVFFNYEQIVFQQPFPIAQFRLMLEPCQCIYGDYIYMKNRRCNELQNEYVCVNRNSPELRNTLAVLADSVAIRDFNTRYDINYFLAKRAQGKYQTSVDEIVKHLDELREQLPLTEQERFKFQPMRSALVNFDTTLFIVDFINKTSFTYRAPGKLLHRKPIGAIHSLKPELFVDMDQRKVYFRQEKKGESTLYEYNFSDHSFKKAVPLKDFHFIGNLKIRNGYLYFLYRDRLAGGNKKIYKYLLPS